MSNIWNNQDFVSGMYVDRMIGLQIREGNKNEKSRILPMVIRFPSLNISDH